MSKALPTLPVCPMTRCSTPRGSSWRAAPPSNQSLQRVAAAAPVASAHRGPAGRPRASAGPSWRGSCWARGRLVSVGGGYGSLEGSFWAPAE
eukprot:177651-Chlamydomonas_euryale.AAC.1